MNQPGLPFENAAAHPQRDAVLGEVHARPFQSLEPPCRLFHYAFLTDSAAAKADLQALTAFCLAQGVAEPAPQAKHHRINLGSANLRWEQHSEFTTYTIAVVASATEQMCIRDSLHRGSNRGRLRFITPVRLPVNFDTSDGRL